MRGERVRGGDEEGRPSLRSTSRAKAQRSWSAEGPRRDAERSRGTREGGARALLWLLVMALGEAQLGTHGPVVAVSWWTHPLRCGNFSHLGLRSPRLRRPQSM